MTSLFLAVILAWDPSPTPGVKYRLYYGPNSGQQTIFEDAGTSTTWEVKDLPPGVPIYFVARAYIGVSESGPSNEVVYTQPVPTPNPTPSWQQSKITDLRVASGTNSGVTITWTKPSEAVNHIVYWDDDPVLDDSQHEGNPPTMINNLVAGTTYYFEVRALNGAGVLNQPSNRVTYTPGAVAPTPNPTPSWQESKITDLRVASGTNSGVTITWTKPSEAVNHIVYWDDDPVLDDSQHEGNPPTMINNLVAGTTYYFEVRALNGAGVLNQPSNRVTYTPGAVAPTPNPTPSWQESKITDLRVASGTNSGVTITWTKPSEAVNHIVYWDDDPVLDDSQHEGNPPTMINNLVAGTTYYFEVRALNGAGVLNQPSNRVTYTP